MVARALLSWRLFPRHSGFVDVCHLEQIRVAFWTAVTCIRIEGPAEVLSDSKGLLSGPCFTTLRTAEALAHHLLILPCRSVGINATAVCPPRREVPMKGR